VVKKWADMTIFQPVIGNINNLDMLAEGQGLYEDAGTDTTSGTRDENVGGGMT
jgi:hypothetical protein